MNQLQKQSFFFRATPPTQCLGEIPLKLTFIKLTKGVLMTLLSGLATCSLPALDWPEFRGPTGQGISEAKDVPLKWSGSENVVWKTAIPGSGWSSPVLVNGRLYVTAAVPLEGASGLSLRALCLDAQDGKLLWSAEVFTPEEGS